MKRKKRLRVFIIILLLILGAIAIFIYFYNPRKAIDLILPDMSRITYINANVKNDSIRTKVDVIVQNKSPYKLTIDTVYFQINLNNELLLQESVPVQLEQKRYQVDTVELPVDISRKKLKSILGNLKGIDSTGLEVNCYVKYNTIFGKVKLRYNKLLQIPVPIPPKIKVLKVERKKYNIAEKKLFTNIQLEIINMGRNIDLQLTDIHYQLHVENALSSEGVINKKVTIKPKSTETIELPVEIKVEHPIKTVLAILTDNDKMNYTLNLQALLVEHMVDKIEQDPIPIEINASGKLELKK